MIWDKIHGKIDNWLIPYWLRIIIYFFELLTSYDWRYARDWIAYNMERNK